MPVETGLRTRAESELAKEPSREIGAFVLILESGSPWAEARLAGLPIVLRLALTAQAGGAIAVVTPPETAHLVPLLADRRLSVPVLANPPGATRIVRMPADCVVHPEHFCSAREGFAPIVVRDGVRAEEAETALFGALGKSSDGWLSRWLNRRISRRISRWVVRTPLTPHHLSIATLCLGLCSAAIVSHGSYGSQVAGAALLQIQSILDGCDGELARVTHRTSLVGEWLDTIADNVTNYAFIGCAAWGLYRAGYPLAYTLGGVIAIIVSCTLSAILYRDLIRLGTGDVLRHPLLGHPADTQFVRNIRPIFKRDTFLFLLFCAAVLNVLGPALIALAFGAIVLFGHLLRVEFRGLVHERGTACRSSASE